MSENGVKNGTRMGSNKNAKEWGQVLQSSIPPPPTPPRFGNALSRAWLSRTVKPRIPRTVNLIQDERSGQSDH